MGPAPVQRTYKQRKRASRPTDLLTDQNFEDSPEFSNARCRYLESEVRPRLAQRYRLAV